jgi:hypothetical protein
VELYEQIRQEYEHGAATIRAVARKLGVHRREVRKALASAMPAERKVPERERPKLAAAIPFINAILESDRKAPRKQRLTAHRIWTRLRRDRLALVGVAHRLAGSGPGFCARSSHHVRTRQARPSTEKWRKTNDFRQPHPYRYRRDGAL